jgi:hypothetical protein
MAATVARFPTDGRSSSITRPVRISRLTSSPSARRCDDDDAWLLVALIVQVSFEALEAAGLSE